MGAYLEYCSFGHIFDGHIDGLDLFVVIWFVHDLASVLDCFLLWTKPSRDVIDIRNLDLSLLRVGETYGSTESNNPYAGVGSFHSRYHYLEGSSSVVSEKVYLR
jgi:hypothetical protein